MRQFFLILISIIILTPACLIKRAYITGNYIIHKKDIKDLSVSIDSLRSFYNVDRIVIYQRSPHPNRAYISIPDSNCIQLILHSDTVQVLHFRRKDFSLIYTSKDSSDVRTFESLNKNPNFMSTLNRAKKTRRNLCSDTTALYIYYLIGPLFSNNSWGIIIPNPGQANPRFKAKKIDKNTYMGIFMYW